MKIALNIKVLDRPTKCYTHGYCIIFTFEFPENFQENFLAGSVHMQRTD